MQLPHLSEARRKEISSLGRTKGRSIHGQMLVEGRRLVEAALLANAPVVEVLLTEAALDTKPSFTAILDASIQKGAMSVCRITEKAARSISTVETHQGVFAVVRIVEAALEDLMEAGSVLALDGVQDPGNVGTIIRTAAWFGLGGVLAGDGTADFYNPKVVRASMGGLWDLKLARRQDLAPALLSLRENGFRLVCADLDGTALHGWDPPTRCVLVIGSEAQGVSEPVRSIVDEAVTVEGAAARRSTESLNAGMAAGIIMHHWMRAGRSGGT